ncbi:hypothetical protein [Pseudoxanthomonas indica]|uniref:Uncharacterized protein n=1 Tax=Pseudoxanthomonas indica TaxID=428993 RepID=A0A1T5LSJ4_9GAMM|nr:hypothetical protein [Pseudoxanthomonas indica]GGD38925.1 hypothetical protein GCM10007235_08820 [Pseudoxanthomonas indica]SKC78871.1 hypothetical protein SAMN06296058_3003 [Pseudoxanthomonas indica]
MNRLLFGAAAIAALVILQFAFEYYTTDGVTFVHPVTWFMGLEEDERAAWMQAWFSVLAIAVAAGIGLHQAADARRVAKDAAAAEAIRQGKIRGEAKLAQMLETNYLLMELAQDAERLKRAWAVINAGEDVNPEQALGEAGKRYAATFGTMTLDRPLDGYLGDRDLYVPAHLESIRQAELSNRNYDRAIRHIATFLAATDVTVGQVMEWKDARLIELDRVHRFSVEAIDAIAEAYNFRRYAELFKQDLGNQEARN